ncbi:MAG: 4Fe-4S binding protein [Deltaproteobacteria bacterium]|nr:4Fe-4S binding protein [Deltaproteobacteria bacterium]
MSDQKKDVEEKALKGSITLNEQRCKGCTYCITFCPTGAIKMGDKLNEKGYTMPALVEPFLCTGCDLCGTYCPEFAIRGYRLNKKGED